MFKTLNKDHRFQLYLLLLSLVGLVLILLTTSKYGAGVSSDAARNLSTADSLLMGKGFVDMLGAPLILWPPLYPLLLTGLSLLTKWGTFQSAWYLNVLLFGVNIWLSGWLLYLVFPERPLFAAAGALAVLLSRSMLRIHANVASEPLFEALFLLFLLAAATYLRDASWGALWGMFILAGLAAMQRYPGVILIATGIVVAARKQAWQTVAHAALPALAATLPITAWVAFHNYPASETLFGPRDLGAMLPLENINLSLTKILWWFIPRLAFLDPLLMNPWIPLLIFSATLIAITKRADWVKWIQSLSGAYVWPGLLISVVYFFLLAFTVVTADHLDLTSDRYYVVIFPIAVVFVLITLENLVLSRLKLSTPLARALLGAIAVLWFTYPAYAVQGYIRQALVQGEPSNYNIANSANFREMAVVKAAASILGEQPSALIYSNYLNVVWFIYHHPVQALPFENANLPRAQRLAALRQSYPKWPEHSGYIIWFTPNQYHHIVAPDELMAVAKLDLLYADETGQVYYATAIAP